MGHFWEAATASVAVPGELGLRGQDPWTRDPEMHGNRRGAPGLGPGPGDEATRRLTAMLRAAIAHVLREPPLVPWLSTDSREPGRL